MPDLTPHARARAAIAHAQADTQLAGTHGRERVLLSVDEAALEQSVVNAIEAAVLDATKPLREINELIVRAQDVAEMSPHAQSRPRPGAAWNLGYWVPCEERGVRFVATLTLLPEHFERARAALQEPRDD